MQLDNTRITVRERNYFDTLDLALRVIRAYGWRLALALAAGAVPMMVLDAWLLAGYREADFQLGFPVRYMMWTLVLVAWQVPLAGAPATLYLGHVLFGEQPRPKTIARKLWESLPQLLFYQGLLRPFFLGWRYLNEVILLERNPIRSGESSKSTFGRSRTLHRGEGGDLFARSFGSLAVGMLLFVSVWLSMLAVRTMLSGRWSWDEPMATSYFALALWIVASYFTVVRFLSYLDLRIRREGWEVELLMRAERARFLRYWK